MRILHVRLQNLNSLVGEWAIDFSHPAYQADSIFAITGPTGAGKTTILDAVCLALYGRTPRLAKVTKGINEIMSRQTGECYAETTFVTDSGQYRCHWSQRRAHRKPTGELQSPKHEIADVCSGTVLESSIRGVAGLVEQFTGMDFERFTRSMLLAQGGFAAFLQANPDERAPLLEQITGTEEYSRISVAVHERWTAERRQLSILQAELSGIRLLDKEQEHLLRAEYAEKSRSDEELANKIAVQNKIIAWFDAIDSLENEQVELRRRMEQLEQRQRQFSDERCRLKRALQALEISGAYQILMDVRRQIQIDRQRLEGFRETLPTREAAVAKANEAMDKTTAELAELRERKHGMAGIIGRVRRLDAEIREKDEIVKALKAAAEMRESRRNRLVETLELNRKEWNGKQAALTEMAKKLRDTVVDDGLVADYSGLAERCSGLKEVRLRCADTCEQLAEAGRLAGEAEERQKERELLVEQSQKAADEIRQTLRNQEHRLNLLLQNRKLHDWREELAGLREDQSRVREIIAAALLFEEAKKNLADLRCKQQSYGKQQEQEQIHLQGLLDRQAVLEEERNEGEAQHAHLVAVHSMEESRRDLQDGKPCPLCGSLDHPYSHELVSVSDEVGEKLETTRRAIAAISEAIAASRVKLAELGKDAEHLATRIAEVQASADHAERRFAADGELSPLTAITGMTNVAEKQALLELQAEKLARGAAIVSEAEGIDQEIRVLQSALQRSGEETVQAVQALQEARFTFATANRQRELLTEEERRLAVQCEKMEVELRNILRPYRNESTIEDLDSILVELQQRRERRRQAKEQEMVLARAGEGLQVQIGQLEVQLRQADEELATFHLQLDELRRARKTLREERYELFAEYDPDQQEQVVADAIAQAESRAEQCRQILQEANRNSDTLRAGIAAIENVLIDRTEQLRQQQASFNHLLPTAGFCDEDDFTGALLAEEARAELAVRAQQLDDEQAALQSRQNEITKQLVAERAKAMSRLSRAEAGHEVNGLLATQKAVQQELGALLQRIRDNDALKKQLREKYDIVSAQQRECSCWDDLHELIGSADGKKYRNFAQSLTFEVMISFANLQLRKMTERYLLVRDDQQPLELNVVDTYQAGEIRSTKNLSGGECFLVSLSLALGLSQMASRKVRVDSLFLDEGFGTLDDEALDTALETLAGLQEEGKLIGIISHVPALRERIGTRIQVIPRTGGRSVISGPGCSGAAR